MTNVIIDEDITSIPKETFKGFNVMTSINIPSTVTTIKSINAFDGCNSLKEINVNANNEQYESDGGVLIDKVNHILMKYPVAKEGTSYEIPSDVTVLGESSFEGSSLLTVMRI